jgi:alcohol dehydrogenase
LKALVYRGPGKKRLEDVPKPALHEATDAVVQMTKTTIFGNAGRKHVLKVILSNE